MSHPESWGQTQWEDRRGGSLKLLPLCTSRQGWGTGKRKEKCVGSKWLPLSPFDLQRTPPSLQVRRDWKFSRLFFFFFPSRQNNPGPTKTRKSLWQITGPISTPAWQITNRASRRGIHPSSRITCPGLLRQRMANFIKYVKGGKNQLWKIVILSFNKNIIGSYEFGRSE